MSSFNGFDTHKDPVTGIFHPSRVQRVTYHNTTKARAIDIASELLCNLCKSEAIVILKGSCQEKRRLNLIKKECVPFGGKSVYEKKKEWKTNKFVQDAHSGISQQ